MAFRVWSGREEKSGLVINIRYKGRIEVKRAHNDLWCPLAGAKVERASEPMIQVSASAGKGGPASGIEVNDTIVIFLENENESRKHVGEGGEVVWGREQIDGGRGSIADATFLVLEGVLVKHGWEVDDGGRVRIWVEEVGVNGVEEVQPHG